MNVRSDDFCQESQQNHLTKLSNAGRKRTAIWACFSEVQNDTVKTKRVECRYCNYRFVAQRSRMVHHIMSNCEKIPPVIREEMMHSSKAIELKRKCGGEAPTSRNDYTASVVYRSYEEKQHIIKRMNEDVCEYHSAISGSKGNVDEFKELVDYIGEGYNVNESVIVQWEHGEEPLSPVEYAARLGYVDIVKYLFKHKFATCKGSKIELILSATEKSKKIFVT